MFYIYMYILIYYSVLISIPIFFILLLIMTLSSDLHSLLSFSELLRKTLVYACVHGNLCIMVIAVNAVWIPHNDQLASTKF